ncbi:ComF family protein [Enterococcus montenegrensis]|uniref:ComF family protein n=1 Tax=Enterococcus montenegrensis TaxID=3031993 RepID=UPI00249F4BF8|nr:ComF family protein [Enterococcus montenegrensis]WHA08440.1 ComF family protein [Enterococcus montenegrensis]
MKCSNCQQKISRNLLIQEIIFPWLLANEELCEDCLARFQKIEAKRACEGCMRPNCDELCQDCQKWRKMYPDFVLYHQALYHYNDAFKEWLYRYKFEGDYPLCHTFSLSVKQALKRYRDFIIVPLPLSKERQKERGFNQVEELLKAAGITYENILIRKQHDPPQASKKRTERLGLKQPYIIKKDVIISGRKFLLVDDVYTTGRTLYHGVALLYAHNAKAVATFTLAR